MSVREGVLGLQPMLNPAFGRYILLKRIAEGGMAEIFRAMSFGAADFKKLVVIKRILPQLSEDHQFVDMFINEAKIVANLSHPNIVQIYDFGNIDGQLYHCMEYVHGKNLDEIVQAMRGKDPTATIQPACFIILAALEGLDQAHRQRDNLGRLLQIIHRDISPSNILISFDGEVKITDFGIAKVAQSTVNTVGGVIKGKFGYLSPEQGKGEPLDLRTDIFSLGICFYEILTLTSMYGDSSGLLALDKVVNADFRRPRDVNPAIPEALEAILLKALAENREDRFATGADFRRELIGFIGEHKIHRARPWLAEFMQGMFAPEVEAERAQLILEDRLADKLRPDAETISRLENQPADEVHTIVVDLKGAAPGSRQTLEQGIAALRARAREAPADDGAGDFITTEQKPLRSPPVNEEEEKTLLDPKLRATLQGALAPSSGQERGEFPPRSPATQQPMSMDEFATVEMMIDQKPRRSTPGNNPPVAASSEPTPMAHPPGKGRSLWLYVIVGLIAAAAGVVAGYLFLLSR